MSCPSLPASHFTSLSAPTLLLCCACKHVWTVPTSSPLSDLRCPHCTHNFGACRPPYFNRPGWCLSFKPHIMWSCWCCGRSSLYPCGTTESGMGQCGHCGYEWENGGCGVRKVWTAKKERMEALMGKKIQWERYAGDVEFRR